MRILKVFTLLSGVCAALAITGLTGCQSWERHDERTSDRSDYDHRITMDVRSALQREPVYKFSGIDVRTFNGVVQLSGFVNTEDQKRRAAEVAQTIPGVGQIVNSIVLKSENPSPTGGVEPNRYPEPYYPSNPPRNP